VNDPLAHAKHLFLNELKAIKQEFRNNPEKVTLLEKVHKLKGGAGFLGFNELELKAKNLDIALKSGAAFDVELDELLIEISNLLRV